MKKNTFKKVQQVLFIILIANLLVALLKIAIGSLIKSASMLADGFHSLSDGSSNVVGLIGIRLASKPQDKEHPYGHSKFETLSSLCISAMLFFVGGKVIISAIGRFQNPVVPNVSIASLLVLVVTLIINIVVSVSEYKKGKQLNSSILICDSMHTRSDIYVSIGVLVTLIGVKLGLPPVIDSFASLIVSGFILHAAYEIFRENSDILVDRSAVDMEEIRQLVSGFSEVKDTHNIRSRGSRDSLYIDLHILVDSNLSVEKSHKLAHEIEKKIRDTINSSAQVNAHVEPYSTTHTDDYPADTDLLRKDSAQET